LKSSRWSIGFGCTWGDITSWYNSGALEKKEKYLVGIAAEFFLRVYYLFFRIRPLQVMKEPISTFVNRIAYTEPAFKRHTAVILNSTSTLYTALQIRSLFISSKSQQHHYLLQFSIFFSSQDYKTLEIPTQISENQKKRCEQIEQGVRKHLQQGNDKIYSDACPIRLWTSILKYHKEAPEFMKAFMRECDTRNGKYSLFMVLLI